MSLISSPNPKSGYPDRRRTLLSRPAGVAATLLLLGLFLGCMSMNIGSLNSTDDCGVLEQKGNVTLHGSKPQTVYYPIPYASTPNLTLKDSWRDDDWEIMEQQSDHFTVWQRCSSTREVTWKAKGLRGPSSAAPVVVAAASSPAPAPATPVLPAAPIPVDSAKK
jgi:hypothetical protein